MNADSTSCAATPGNLLTVAEKRTPRGWMFSTVALRLRAGGSVIYSPTRLLPPAAHVAIEGVGRPAILLAPNHYHHMGLSEFRERYPEAVCVCSETARLRLEKQGPHRFQPLSVLAERLPDEARLVEPPGTRNGEVWLEIDGADGPLWVVSDAFFNVPRTPGGFIGLFCRVTGTTPGLRIGSTWKYLALRDRRRYAEWLLSRLHAAPPAALIPSHGEPVAGPDLGARVIALVERRLV